MEMAEVPLKTIKCGKWFKSSKSQGNCFLSCQIKKSVPLLEFVWKSGNDNKDGQSVTFQCADVSAVDLRVNTKFGSIDAMKGTIIVECFSPVILQTVDSDNMGKDIHEHVKISGTENFILQAKFHVNETGAVRDIVRQFRSSCSNLKERKTDENEFTKVSTFKEGLPDWVGFIPHYLYSWWTRQAIDLAIFIYMVFSVTWALWQLYRHVDFVRQLVMPLIDIFQYQYQLLDNLVHLLNTIFEEYTMQWLCFIKPLYTVGTTIASPLLKILAQLSPLLYVILRSLTSVWQVLKPVAKPLFTIGYQFVQFIGTIFQSLKTLVARFWSPFYNVSVPAMVSGQFKSVRRVLRAVYYGSLHQAQHLDPLKAQLSVMRTTVVNSCKALGLGIAHLMRLIYKIIWLRRSAKSQKEE